MHQSTSSTSLNVMLDTLSSTYRRRILLAIADHNPRDEDEFMKPSLVPDKADDELRQLETQLRHVHLRKLADDGYIEWNPGTEMIRREPNFDGIAPLLTLMDDHEDELPDDWP